MPAGQRSFDFPIRLVMLAIRSSAALVSSIPASVLVHLCLGTKATALTGEPEPCLTLRGKAKR